MIFKSIVYKSFKSEIRKDMDERKEILFEYQLTYNKHAGINTYLVGKEKHSPELTWKADRKDQEKFHVYHFHDINFSFLPPLKGHFQKYIIY